MIGYVFFDFDGTLVDSNQIKKQAFFDVTKEFPEAKKTLNLILSNPNFGDRYKIFKYLAEELNSSSELLNCIDSEKLVKDYTHLCERRITQASFIFGAETTLRKLSKLGIRLFVSSSTPDETLINILVQKALDSYFDKIYGSSTSKQEHIEDVINSFGCNSSEILYVGDSEVDRVASLKTNCHFIGIGANYSRFNVKPNILNESLIDLPEWINTINNRYN